MSKSNLAAFFEDDEESLFPVRLDCILCLIGLLAHRETS